jgi:exodeoxyribonuclease-3
LLTLTVLNAQAQTATPAQAQTYPSKPIRLVVPFGPGGSGDITARAFAQYLEALIKQPVVIDNRAGANGILGTEVVKNIPGFDDELARVITATVQGVRVIGAYFPNGQAPGTDKFEYKMEWLKSLRAWVKDELAAHPQLVLMGDYNITFDDADVWDPQGMQDQIHCTEEERYHLRALVALGLHDSLRLFPQPPKSYSWWDYRDMAFRRNRGLRIDHILVSEALRARATACTIDKAPRKNERPSDHTPVVLTVA